MGLDFPTDLRTSSRTTTMEMDVGISAGIEKKGYGCMNLFSTPLLTRIIIILMSKPERPPFLLFSVLVTKSSLECQIGPHRLENSRTTVRNIKTNCLYSCRVKIYGH